VIDHQRRLLFIHIARTGGTSIEAALVGRDWWEVDPPSKHLSASQTRTRYGDAVWNDYHTFAVVRNPWDRLVSMWATGWWQEAANAPADLPFRDFVQTLQPHPNEIYQSLHYHEILDEPVDSILRFESLPADFADLLHRRGCDGVPLPHREQRQRGSYREYYDVDTRRHVERVFAADIARFDYTF
jgi:hypothetical protein